MITMASLLPWRKIKVLVQNEIVSRGIYDRNDRAVYYLNKSQSSLLVLIEWFYQTMGKKVTVYVPEIFCYETIQPMLNNEKCTIVFYTVDEQLNPQYQDIKVEQTGGVTFFVFVHYFGKQYDVKRAKEFCKLRSMLLIEDCAHCLIPSSKIGNTGDFVLFSPHKLLPLYDGAVLWVNEKTILENEVQINELHKFIECLDYEKNNYIFLLKKILQKIGIRRKKIALDGMQSTKQRITLPKQISRLSFKLLQSFTREEFLRIKEQRRKNVYILNNILKEYGIENGINVGGACPYVGVYKLNVDRAREMNDIYNFLFQRWPEIPEFANEKMWIGSKRFTDQYKVHPIHQDIYAEQLIKLYKKDKAGQDSRAEWSLQEVQTEQEWAKFLCQCRHSTLTQEFAYGEMKSSEKNTKVIRFKIVECDQIIGVVQVLQRQMGPFKVFRINKGPLFLREDDNNFRWAIKLLKNKYGFFKGGVLLWTPYVEYNYKNLVTLRAQNVNRVNNLYKSGYIWLKCSDEDLLKKFSSNCRNQVRAGKKRNLEIISISSNMGQVVRLYQKNMSEKHFKGISIPNLKYIINNFSDRLLCLGVLYEKKLVAFTMGYIHGKELTYLIGYSDEAGRKLYANNMLLFELMKIGRDKGLEWFDIGGIDEIHTETIAEFKKGFNPIEYELIGDVVII